MLIAAIITGLISLGSFIAWLVTRLKNDYGGNIWAIISFWVFGVIWVITFLSAMKVNIGTQTLTGYIYSNENQVGYTTAHIRFSQNAGTDAQPSFCVPANSDAGREIQKYSGSNTKVQVEIPSYFYFANNPFACGTTKTTIKEIK